MSTVEDKKKKSGKSDEEKYSDIVHGAERRIASLDAERNALGLTEEASAALRYEQDLMNEAQQKGITLSAAQKGELSALAGVMASVEAATKKAKETLDFAKDATKGFLDDFTTGLKNSEGVWKSFGNAAMGVLDKITDKLLNDVVDALFEVNKAGSSGGGILGTLLGGIGSLFGGTNAFGAVSADPWAGGRYAGGTASARAGAALVGEEGPEIVRFKGGEKVIPNHQIQAANNNKNTSGGGHFSYTSNITVSGNGDKELMARMRKTAQEDTRAAFDQYRRNGVQDDIASYNDDPHKRG
jgi:phage-related tail protein